MPKKVKKKKGKLFKRYGMKAKKSKPTWGKNLTATQRFILSRSSTKSRKNVLKKSKKK